MQMPSRTMVKTCRNRGCGKSDEALLLHDVCCLLPEHLVRIQIQIRVGQTWSFGKAARALRAGPAIGVVDAGDDPDGIHGQMGDCHAPDFRASAFQKLTQMVHESTRFFRKA